jgi:hypothetical protein
VHHPKGQQVGHQRKVTLELEAERRGLRKPGGLDSVRERDLGWIKSASYTSYLSYMRTSTKCASLSDSALLRQ